MAEILNGKKIADEILSQLKEKIKNNGIKPKMAIVLCGENPESLLYVSIKQKRSTEVGIDAAIHHFSVTISQQELEKKIQEISNSVDGIIVQLPLPKHLHQHAILNKIPPEKDIDGLTDYNLGGLINNQEINVPATAKGVICLLEKYNILIKGKEIAIINHSSLIGKPLAMLFLNRGATVTICHEHTVNLVQHTRKADILVTAVGIPNFIKSSMIKNKSIIIDIGITKKNEKIIGDVSYEEVKEKASFITPVPGGIGPMTVAMLLDNLITCSLEQNKIKT